jgi:hypothetical protein
MEILIQTFESFSYLIILVGLYLFIYSLLGMQLFSGKFPPGVRQNFDDFVHSITSVY